MKTLVPENKPNAFASLVCGILCKLPIARSLTARIACLCEGGEMFSLTLRRILAEHYGVDVGLYSYGPCLRPGGLPPGTRVGNYCSLAAGLRVFRRNHPIERLSTHPIFFNRISGFVQKDTISAVEDNPLTIGHDVWIGQDVIVAPGCCFIGNAAVIAAGAVVTKDVPDFAVVGGVPAKVIRWRFSSEIQEEITHSAWWLHPLPELVNSFPHFQRELTLQDLQDFTRGISKQKNRSRTK